MIKCANCHGVGWRDGAPCHFCEGAGEMADSSNAVPPGADQMNIFDEPEVETRGDGHLRARTTDPWTSHASSAKTEAAEGITHVLRPRTQKYAVLVEYQRSYPQPLTDHEVTDKANLSSPCPWRRVRDLLDGGFVQEVDTVYDPETKRDVRRCVITAHGAKGLTAITEGAKSYP